MSTRLENFLKGFALASRLTEAVKRDATWDRRKYMEVVMAVCREVGRDDPVAEGIAAGASVALGLAA